jgi:hypothetical protein
METGSLTSQTYFWILSIVHLVMLAGQIIFAGVAIFSNLNGTLEAMDSGLHQILQFIVPGFVLVGFFAGKMIMDSRLKSIKAKGSLRQRLAEYQGVLIVKYTLLEAPSLLGLMGYLLTGNLFYLGFSGLVMLIFIMNKPSRDRIAIDLELNANDKETLYNPEAVLK